MSIDSSVSLPIIRVSGAGSSINGDSDKVLPKITASSSGVPFTGSILSLPSKTAVSAGSSPAGISDQILPVIVGEDDGDEASSPSADSSVSLPVITATGSGYSNESGASDQIIPKISGISSAITSTLGSSDQVLSKVSGVSTAITGSSGISVQVLEVLVASGTGITGGSASSVQYLPIIRALGSAFQKPAGATYPPENPYNDIQEAWAINYETNAPYRFYHFAANSMCTFKGKVYVSNPAGIYEVTGTSDAGRNIDCQITLAKSDLQESKNKRIPYVYMGLRSTGQAVLKVTANADADRYYGLNSGPDYIRGSRATIGKGLQARYWQFAVANRNGSYFEIDSVEFSPILMSRHGV